MISPPLQAASYDFQVSTFNSYFGHWTKPWGGDIKGTQDWPINRKPGQGSRVSEGERAGMEVRARAPGKIILSGEHAVVHGSTAVAASIDLFTYASLRLPPASGTWFEFKVVLYFPLDIFGTFNISFCWSFLGSCTGVWTISFCCLYKLFSSDCNRLDNYCASSYLWRMLIALQFLFRLSSVSFPSTISIHSVLDCLA